MPVQIFRLVTQFTGAAPSSYLGLSAAGLGDFAFSFVDPARPDFALGDAGGIWAVIGEAADGNGLTVVPGLPGTFRIGNLSRANQGRVAVGDIDDDSHDDVLVIDGSGARWLLGAPMHGANEQGYANLVAGTPYTDRSDRATLSDLNGDHRPDLVLAGLRAYVGIDSPFPFDVDFRFDIGIYYAGALGYAPEPDRMLHAEAGLAPGEVGAGPADVHFSMDGGGDFNGDGVQDLLVSVDRVAHAGGSGVGEAWVIYGQTGALLPEGLSLDALTAEQGVRLRGSRSDTNLGLSARFVGDINGDGLDDIAVGGRGIEYQGLAAETVYLVLGRADGTSEIGLEDDWYLQPGVLEFNTNPAELILDQPPLWPDGFTSTSGGTLPTPIAGVGDVNGDGIDDVLIGAPGVAVGGAAKAGEAYLVFGQAYGWWSQQFGEWLDGRFGYRIVGAQAGDLAGYSVAGVGDVDGDGRPDLLIGAPGADGDTGVDAGAAYLLHGGPGHLHALDAADGAADGVIHLGSMASASAPALEAQDDQIAPIAGSRGYAYVSLNADSPLLLNDGYAAGLRIVSVDLSGARNASLSVQDGGANRWVYVAAPAALKPGETITETFTYLVEDEFGQRDTATVQVTVNGVNDGPVAGTDVILRRGAAASFTVNLLANDSDAEGDALTVTALSAPAHGSVQLNGDGSVTYTPGSDRNAPDRFTYTLSDALGATSTGVVEVPALGFPSGLRLVGEANAPLTHGLVAAAGDFNGDGLDDVLAGSGFSGRAAYLLFGSDQSMPSEVAVTALSGTLGLQLRSADAQGVVASISGVGDVNGDGIDDVLLGSGALFSPGGHGEAYLVFGAAAGLPPVIDIDHLDGSNGVRLVRSDNPAMQPTSVAGIGDVNGDGLADFAVGLTRWQYRFDANGRLESAAAAEGTVAVVYGSESGFPAELSLEALPPGRGFSVSSSEAGLATGLGQGLSGGGDFNGDGCADFVVGNGQGTAWLVFGGSADRSATLDLATLDAARGLRVSGLAVLGFGQSMSLQGDFNGDGRADLVVGAPYEQGFAGSAFVWFGQAQTAAGELSVADLDGSNGFSVHGLAGLDGLGRSVASAGDVNGDGIDDLLLGAYGSDRNGNLSGDTYVIFGRRGAYPATFDLTTLDGRNGFVLRGERAFDRLGWTVSAAGDVDGDGHDDLLVGSLSGGRADGSSAGQGAVFVIYGGPDALGHLDGRDGQTDGAVRLNSLSLSRDEPVLATQVFSVNGATSFSEGDSGGHLVTFVVARTGSLAGAATLQYTLAGSGAHPIGADDVPLFTLGNGTLNFAADQALASVQVEIKGDLVVEADELLTLTLNSGSADNGADVLLLDRAATVTVLNDDQPARIALAGTAVGVTESDLGTRTLQFTVQRSGSLVDGVTVSYTLAGNGPRPLGADDVAGGYPGSGVLYFAPGETRKTLSLQVLGDEQVEYDETVLLTLTGAVHDAGGEALWGARSAVGTVRNDDVAATVGVTAPGAVLEGVNSVNYAPPGYVNYTVRRTGDLDTKASVQWEVSTSVLEPRLAQAVVVREVWSSNFVREPDGLQWATESTVFAPEDTHDPIYATEATNLIFHLRSAVRDLVPAFEDGVGMTLLDMPFGGAEVKHFDNGVLAFDYRFGGQLSLDYEADGVDLGQVELDYGVATRLTSPAFTPTGQAFTVKTGGDYTSIFSELTADALQYTTSAVRLNYEVESTLLSHIEVPALDISLDDIVLPGVAADAIDLLRLTADNNVLILTGALLPDALPVVVAGAKVSLAKGISLQLTAPDHREQSQRNEEDSGAGSLSPVELTVAQPLAVLSANSIQIAAQRLPWLNLLSAEVGKDGWSIGFSLLELQFSAGYGLVQEYRFNPTGVKTTVSFHGTEQSGQLGDEFAFVIPDGEGGMHAGTVTYELQGTMDITYRLAPVAEAALLIGQGKVQTPWGGSGFGPVKDFSYAASSEVGSIELFTLHGLALDGLFEPVEHTFVIGAADLRENVALRGVVQFDVGEAEKIISLPLLTDTEPEANANATLTLSNARSADGTPLQITQPQATVKVVDDDVFVRVSLLPRWSWGDPHVGTLDGLVYDFQAAGEFVLLETLPGDAHPLALQVRTEPVPGSDAASVFTAFATQVGSHRVSVDAGTAAGILKVDGVSRLLVSGQAPLELGDGAQIAFDGSEFVIVYPAGDLVRIAVRDGWLDFGVALAEGRSGPVRGLLGNADGAVANDLALRDGTPLTQPLPYDTLLGAYADSWRITPAESLFDYAEGLDSAHYQDTSFPRLHIGLDDLPADARARATAVVDAQGITDPVARAAAILDVALTGHAGFADLGEQLGEPWAAALQVTDLPDLPASISVAPEFSELLEGDDAWIEARFIVYRLGDTEASQPVSVSWSLQGGLDADDLMPGEALSGTLQLDTGAGSGSVMVRVRGDATPEPDERLTLRLDAAVTSAGPLPVAAVQASTLVRNDDGPLPTYWRLVVPGDSLAEGDGSGATTVQLRVERSGDSTAAAAVVLHVRSAAGMTGTLDAADFADGVLPRFELGFAPGQTAQTVTLSLLRDGLVEDDEDLVLELMVGDGLLAAGQLAVLNDDRPPVARDDFFFGLADETLAGTLLGNDDDDDALWLHGIAGAALQPGVEQVLPSGARVVAQADGRFVYTPSSAAEALPEGAMAIDGFDYAVSDGVSTATAHASFAVIGRNDAPRAVADGFELDEGGVLDVSLLANDNDPDRDPLVLASLLGRGVDGGFELDLASGARLVVHADGRLTYDARAAFDSLPAGRSASQTLFYAISDGRESAQALVTFTVRGVNDAPTANDDAFTLRGLVSLGGNLLADNGHGADSDPDEGDGLVVTALAGMAWLPGQSVSLPSGATLLLRADGAFHYTPSAAQRGLAQGQQVVEVVSYTLSDPYGATAQADVSFTVWGEAPATRSVRIGDAPQRLTSATQDAWSRAWSAEGVSLSHRADADDAAEPWSALNLANASPITLAGSDVYLGDLGVSGQTLDSGTIRQAIDGSEGLRVDLLQQARRVSVELTGVSIDDDGLGRLESGRLQAFDAQGQLVAEALFHGDRADGRLTVTLAASVPFSALVLTSGAYDGGRFVDGAYALADGRLDAAPFSESDRWHGSEFLVEAMTFEIDLVGLPPGP